MFYETDGAIRSRIEGMAFSPYAPVISGFKPEKKVRPNRPQDNIYPSIALSRFGMTGDLARNRRGEDLVLGYTATDAVLIKYPDPWIINYQIDLRSSSVGKTAPLEMNRMLEQFLRGPAEGGMWPGFILDVTWTFGAYQTTGKVECGFSEPPQFLGEENDGRFRAVLRIKAATWLFSENTPRTVGRIAYRIFEAADLPEFTNIYKTDDPDGLSP